MLSIPLNISRHILPNVLPSVPRWSFRLTHVRLRVPGAVVAAIALTTVVLAASPAGAIFPQIKINTDTTTQLQNEEQICVNPTDPSNVVACWRDFRLGYRQVGVGYSLDGGNTWVDYLIQGQYPWDSDPVLTVHRDGTFYLVIIDYQNGGNNQFLVYRSTNRGITWDPPFTAILSTSATFEDKEWIAVDRTAGPRDGNLYITWTRFNDVKIMSIRSTNRGATWSSPVQVSDDTGNSQFSVPIVLKNGNVLCAWNTYFPSKITYDISTNGGTSWGTDRTLTATGTAPQTDINGGITVFPYPALALDETAGPRSGFLYCVYADQAVAANGMDIWSRRSTDNGNTWSAAVRVNNDPAGLFRDQFHPWVCCDETGDLTASWYDRRDDPQNYLWHIYYSQSSDGGQTWSANVRITDVPSSPGQAAAEGALAHIDSFEGRGENGGGRDGTRSQFHPLEQTRGGLIGEYSGVSVRAGVIHPVWTDTRNGNQDVFTSVIQTPSAVLPQLALTGRSGMTAVPNPAVRGVELRLDSSFSHGGGVALVDATGRLLRVLPLPIAARGSSAVFWDGRDAAGREMPAGVYFARAAGASIGMEEGTRIVLTR